MAKRIGHGCAVPGCPGIAVDSSYCPEHLAIAIEKNRERQREYDKTRDRSTDDYGYKWRQWRNRFISSHPWCEDPFGVHGDQLIRATDVDHIVPLKAGGTNDWENLQALCHECHSRKTAMHDGRWRRKAERGEGYV